MHKVKMLRHNGYWDYDKDEYTNLISGITEWEEITDEELSYLETNIFKINQKERDWQYKLFIQEDNKIKDFIFSVKELIKKEKIREEKEEKAKKERAEKKKCATIEKRRREYEKLKEEFECHKKELDSFDVER